MRRATVVLMLLLAAVAGPSAVAQEPVAIPAGPSTTHDAAAPVLLDDGSVAWVTGRPSRPQQVMRLAPGGAPTAIAAVPAYAGPRPKHSETYQLGVSDEIVAVHRYAQTCGACRYFDYTIQQRDVVAGPIGAPLTFVAGCGFLPGEPRCNDPSGCYPTSVTVAGSRLATVHRCGEKVRTQLRDIGGSGAVVELPDEVVTGLAGGWSLSYLSTTDELLLRDASDAIVRRFTRTPGIADLAADGTVTLVLAHRVLTVAADGTRTSFPRPRGEVVDVAGGQLLLRDRRERLAVQPIAGGARTRLPVPRYRGGWDFDGATFAYMTSDCPERLLVVQPVGRPAPAEVSRRC